ncbi:hypothetical protein ACNQ2O_02380 [Mycoplasma sp. AA7A]|uniref:hypothetical protein n=1 Tax=Mycoplasma sp. AA7A TaxID=3401665 RepID=UPI003AAC9DF1
MRNKKNITIKSILVLSATAAPASMIATSCNDTQAEKNHLNVKFQELKSQLEALESKLIANQVMDLAQQIKEFVINNDNYEKFSEKQMSEALASGQDLISTINQQFNNLIANVLNQIKANIESLKKLIDKLDDSHNDEKAIMQEAINQASVLNNDTILPTLNEWNNKLAKIYNDYKDLTNKPVIEPDAAQRTELINQITDEKAQANNECDSLKTNGYNPEVLEECLKNINLDNLPSCSLDKLKEILSTLQSTQSEVKKNYTLACDAVKVQINAVVNNIQSLNVSNEKQPEAYQAISEGLKNNAVTKTSTLNELKAFLANLTVLYNKYKDINNNSDDSQEVAKQQAIAKLKLAIATATGQAKVLLNNGYEPVELNNYLKTLTDEIIANYSLPEVESAIAKVQKLEASANENYATVKDNTIKSLNDVISKINNIGITQSMSNNIYQAIQVALSLNNFNAADTLANLKTKLNNLNKVYEQYKNSAVQIMKQTVQEANNALAAANALVSSLKEKGYETTELSSYLSGIKVSNLSTYSFDELKEIISKISDLKTKEEANYKAECANIKAKIDAIKTQLKNLNFNEQDNPKAYKAINEALKISYSDTDNLNSLNNALASLTKVYDVYKNAAKIDPAVQALRTAKLELVTAQEAYNKLIEYGYTDAQLGSLLTKINNSTLESLSIEELNKTANELKQITQSAWTNYNQKIAQLKSEIDAQIKVLNGLNINKNKYPDAYSTIQKGISQNQYTDSSTLNSLNASLSALKNLYKKYKDINNSPSENYNWGDVPLPKVPDNQITQEMLVDMFDKMIGKQVVNFTLGDRLITTDAWNNAFLEWQFTKKTNYSYFTVDSNQMAFTYKNKDGSIQSDGYFPNTPQYVNNTTWYVRTGSFKYTYMEAFRTPGKVQDAVFKFVRDGMNQIKEGMSEWDKAFALWKYVKMWFIYKPVARLDLAIQLHTGVCRDMASSYAILLQMAGIKAFAWPTGKAKELPEDETSGGHMVVWMKLPVNDQNQPDPSSKTYKWFDSDITYESAEAYYLYPLSHYKGDFGGIITAPSTSQFVPNVSGVLLPYTFNNLYGLPYNTLYLNDEVMLNSERDYLASTTIMGGKANGGSSAISPNYVYNNGKWYGFSYSPNRWSAEGTQLKADGFITEQTFNQATGTEVTWDIQKTYKQQMLNAITRSYKALSLTPNFSVNLYSYKDSIAIPIYDNIDGYSILIYDVKTKAHTVSKIGNKDKVLYNFNIQNDQVYVTWTDNTKIETKMEDPKLATWFNSQPKYNKQDLINELAYYKFTLGGYTIGSNVYQISEQNKNDFLDKWNEINAKTHENLSNEQINQLVQEVRDNYKNNLLDPSYANAKTIVITRNLNEFDSVSQGLYNEYGYQINISAINDKSQILGGNLSLRANVYYSQTKLKPGKEGWQKVISNKTIDALSLNKNIIQNPQGYYYVEIYNEIFPNDIVNSEVLYLECSSTSPTFDAFSQITVNGNSQNSNYNANDSLWYQNTSLEYSFMWTSVSTYPINAKIHFIDFATKKDTVIQEFNNTELAKLTKWNKALGLADSNNSGIYYVKYTITDNANNQQTFKVISKLGFVFTQDNWNTITMKELNDLIKPIYQN